MPFAIQDKKILNKCKLIWNKKSYYIRKKMINKSKMDTTT